MAERALKISIDADSHNYESLNNLAVLLQKKDDFDQSLYYYSVANKEGELNVEAYYN